MMMGFCFALAFSGSSVLELMRNLEILLSNCHNDDCVPFDFSGSLSNVDTIATSIWRNGGEKREDEPTNRFGCGSVK